MTDLDELKEIIVKTVPDQEVASSACCEAQAYAKRWPFVVMINDWDVWNDSRSALRLQVIRWLEQHADTYDFYQPLVGCGLVGFKDLKAAAHFKLRWSGQGRIMPTSAQDWNPHPLKSTFESPTAGKVEPKGDRPSRRDDRCDRTRSHGMRSFHNHRI